jgi:hypothetical protein
MKRAWLIIGIILLLGGVVFEEKHRAETVKKHTFPAISTEQDPEEDTYLIPKSNFSGQVDLWGDPWVKTDDPDLTYASLAFKNGLKEASIEKFQARPDNGAEPVLTVLDRQVAYALFELGGVKLKFNLKPAFPNPEALLPTRLDPSITGSFSF